MIRLTRLPPILFVVAAVAFSVSGCGAQKISIPKADPSYSADLAAAQLFDQRCGGCHTLSYAGTHGSGQNPRTYEAINGPNFNERCERPVERVLYAIENGGFSGAYMPQNIVVGEQAREVAMFVARFAGRQAPTEPGVATCDSIAIGSLPALPASSSGS
jgi:mono/diheme cytochrome c family protein